MTPDGATVSEKDRETAGRIVWPTGRTGDADEMGYHIRDLNILVQCIAQALSAARAEEREKCIHAACQFCREGHEPIFVEAQGWRHKYQTWQTYCHAGSIRARAG